MGKLLPKTKEDCWRLVLLPFKAYIAAAWICFLFAYNQIDTFGELRHLAFEQAKICSAVIYGYGICVGALLVGTALASLNSETKNLRRSALLFAGIGLFAIGILAPGASVPAIK